MAKCHVVQELRAYALKRLHPAKMMLGKARHYFCLNNILFLNLQA